jgi:outer membrane protein assembly factor BamB
MRPFGCALVLLLASLGVSLADHWPGFRGLHGDGQTAEKKVPLSWSATENVRWKIELPAAGNSSPIVWGDRIFLTQPLDKDGHKRALLCLDRKNGKRIWQRDVEYEDKDPTFAPFYYAQATPVTDGQRVIVSYGSAGLYCYDFKGNEKWRYDLGKLTHIWNNASSPVLYDNLVILWCGPGERNFLVAVDKTTGQKVWQHNEPDGKRDEYAGSWSTPVVAKVNGQDELIVLVSKKVKGFDPKTGTERWSCSGLGPLVYTSPAVSADGIVVAFAGYGGAALAVRAGGKGDVTETHRLWVHNKGNPQRIGSPVIIGEHCYLVSESGQAHCFELKTGKNLWEDAKLDQQTWSSLIATADGKLLVSSFTGDTFVLEASPKFNQIAKNTFGSMERVNASVTISDGELFIRSSRHLWCIAEKK